MTELGLEGYAGFGTIAIGISGTAKRGKGQCGRLRPNQAGCSTESEGQGDGVQSPLSGSMWSSLFWKLVGGLFGLGVRMQVYLLSPE